jgi:hypothetical protein
VDDFEAHELGTRTAASQGEEPEMRARPSVQVA